MTDQQIPHSIAVPPSVFIVDDEAPARSRLRALLEECRSEWPYTLVGEAASGSEALERLGVRPVDVVLLDIHMPVMSGLELARHLLRFPTPPAVIFTTAHDEHALAAFDVGALDYLLKPFRAQRLLQALKRLRPLRQEDEKILLPLAPHRRHFTVTDRGRIWLVPVEDALYLRAELKYVTLRTRSRELVLDESLSHLETEFAADFLRIHRNCLVNRQHLLGFEMKRSGDNTEEGHWVALLRDWTEVLPVSRRQSEVVKAFRNQN